MPIYEYACGACGHSFEEWQKMSDPPVKTCPKCKKRRVEKLISQTAFQLKGGGWYKDLYSSSKPGAAASDGGGASGKDGGGDAPPAGGKDAAPKTGKTEATAAKGDAAKDSKKKESPKKSETRAA